MNKTIHQTETYVYDEDNNRAYFETFGGKEKAVAALNNLFGCRGCCDCRHCSYCHNCSDCGYCRGCSDCCYCSNSGDCRGCSYCSDCGYCRGCSDCCYCSNSGDCRGCSYCRDCRGCRNCSDCRGCSYYSEKNMPEIPLIDDIHKKLYEAVSAPDKSLEMSRWHTCETTHCRAGWITTLAGEKGRALEQATSTLFAAMQIYKKAGYKISPNRFFDSNEKAMEDIKRLAGVEA